MDSRLFEREILTAQGGKRKRWKNTVETEHLEDSLYLSMSKDTTHFIWEPISLHIQCLKEKFRNNKVLQPWDFTSGYKKKKMGCSKKHRKYAEQNFELWLSVSKSTARGKISNFKVQHFKTGKCYKP